MTHFISANKDFNLFLSKKLLEEVVNYCRIAHRNETGGIIIGSYSADLSGATVSKIMGPPVDSRSGFSWFERGTEGVKKAMDDLWQKQQQFYLGEWHYHPYSSPNPSRRDLLQMREVAEDPNFACPEPIMLIAGGNPKKSMLFRAFVFPAGKMVELLPTGEEHEG
ncbi:Mov34/MPN/PAD-1 family protein [Microvirga sp. STR05]|uniref:Mov34/MPN/PAD-1 family protein n=1 Tax=Hymenobacter duratus TaxID=2771356 RepID=A0ABR8JNB6_9BACT|nr:Mov34/MPN/PAD-1 family protein [Hymenobacter duratus]MBD2717108.1 Mov34/MPN/PAD-1 family protein [Hymenobacter duratus]MBR7952024.1 Mov34/MPN/PAD-1 family protein [Microvirga sp. STR05]